jgi:uncharacterized RDD family membrane protein YckC
MEIIGESSKGRLIAAFFDHLIAFILMMLVEALVPENLPVLKAILFFLVYLAYFVVLEAIWSRTVGKFFQGLIVRKLDGSRCGWKASLIRNGLRVLEVNPLLFGGIPAAIAIFSSRRKQRVGDMLAGTLVVSNKLRWSTHGTDQAF